MTAGTGELGQGMRVKLLTLAYSPSLQGFDDRPRRRNGPGGLRTARNQTAASLRLGDDEAAERLRRTTQPKAVNR